MHWRNNIFYYGPYLPSIPKFPGLSRFFHSLPKSRMLLHKSRKIEKLVALNVFVHTSWCALESVKLRTCACSPEEDVRLAYAERMCVYYTSRMPSQSIFYTFWTNYRWVSDVLQLLSIRLRSSSLISAILQLISNRLSIPAFYWQYQLVCSFFLRYLRVCPYKWLHIVVCVSLCSHRTYHDLEWLNVKLWRHKYWNCVKNDDPGKIQKIQGFCLNGRPWQVCYACSSTLYNIIFEVLIL